MKKSWWKGPLYCTAASWVCFQLYVRFLGRFTLEILPDGTITSDNTRTMILSAGLFLVVICVGGLCFFRSMTRKEIFCSASVLAALNLVLGLIVYQMQGMASIYFAEFTEWSSFISRLLFQITQNIWITAIITWIFPPYVFVLFGKKAASKS